MRLMYNSKRMKLGVSTASYFPHTRVEDTFDKLALLKPDACEIFFETHSQYCEEFAKIMLDRMKKAQEVHPFVLHSVHSLTNQFEPDLFSVGPRARADAIQTLNNFLSVGKFLGAKYYTFHGATILKRTSKANMDFDRIAKIYNELHEIAEGYGIDLCYENVHWTYYHFPEFIEELEKRCEKLSTVLDIKQARQAGYTYKDFIYKMGKHLRTVHVCDYDENGITKIPGRGIVDFVELFKILQDMGFDGSVLMEVYSKDYASLDELKESYDYLKVCLDKSKK